MEPACRFQSLCIYCQSAMKKKEISLLLIKNCCFVHPAKLFPSSSRVCSVSNSNEDDSKEAEEENRQP